jgi:hypothetical protein
MKGYWVTKRLPGGSLLESVLALCLIAGALSAAVALHSQMLGSDRAMDRLGAWSAMQAVLKEPIVGPGVHHFEQVDEWSVERRVSVIARQTVRVDMTCTRNGRVALEHSIIRPIP